jgi:hypothetical protein
MCGVAPPKLRRLGPDGSSDGAGAEMGSRLVEGPRLEAIDGGKEGLARLAPLPCLFRPPRTCVGDPT